MREAGEPDQAIREFEEGARRFPKEQTAFRKLIVDALIGQQKKTEAIKLNDQILRENPNDADAGSRQAEYLLQNGEIDKSISYLKAILVRSPGHGKAHYNLGLALLASGRREEARFQFSETLRLIPTLVAARIALTNVQIVTGEFGNAVVSADEILAGDPKHGEAQLLRAIALRGLGKFEDARAQINAVLAMYPKYDEALFQLGDLNVMGQKWQEAEAAYRRSYEANPSNIRGLLAIADLKMRNREVKQAVDTLRIEVSKHPERLDLRFAMATVASGAGLGEEAAAEFNLLLEQVPAKSAGARGDQSPPGTDILSRR